MKMLMLTLPFMVRDLIAPEVHSALYHDILSITMYILSITKYILTCTLIYQVKLINTAIDNAKGSSRLRGLQHVADPSAEVVEVLIQCMEWNIATRQSRIPEEELPELHDKAVALLDLLQQNLPDKTGEKGRWNFEKAHSILHKVREIILWGNSDNTSCQAPEVCDILCCTAIYSDILRIY
jgi:hypothetical protein